MISCIPVLIACSPNSNVDFAKCFSAQHCVISMIEKWKKSWDSGDHSGALLTGLPKAFECIDHELLLAKLYA